MRRSPGSPSPLALAPYRVRFPLRGAAHGPWALSRLLFWRPALAVGKPCRIWMWASGLAFCSTRRRARPAEHRPALPQSLRPIPHPPCGPSAGPQRAYAYPLCLFSGINLEPWSAVRWWRCCAPFYMPFWWLEVPHKATRSPGRVTPQHPRSVNGIQRTKATSVDIDYLRLLFPACQVGRAPPWTACRATQPPHGDGRSSCRHLQAPGRLCQTKVIKKPRIAGQTLLQRAKPAVGDWNAEGTF
jgi:hypothetical protein